MSEPFTRDQVITACRALGLDPRRVVDLRIEPRRVTVVTAEPVLPIRRVTTVHPIATDGEADYLPLIVQRLTKPIQGALFGGAA